jgi:16S rRNA G966 N2-methylase RsmD
MTTYPGGKNGAGVYQQIINLMPPHRIYIEPFLGSGAILRMKRAAAASIGIDIDAAAIDRIEHDFSSDGMFVPVPNLELYCEDGLTWLSRHFDFVDAAGVMVYLDPPYLMETRRHQGRLYRYEFMKWDHLKLLDLITSFKHCNVMISGYYSDIYSSKLAGWSTKTFQTRTHTYTVTEWLWFNYSEPTELHDYRFLGENFRERERIKKKKKRWVARLARMDALERQALLSVIQDSRSTTTPETASAAVDPEAPYLVVAPGVVIVSGEHHQK